ncbi:DHH family phosphoesterase, partial [Candidatus Bathyarchaeota archaeon]|nr:DHH family phosphoesterase [Candidatus Bathyarchaeota archaeon]
MEFAEITKILDENRASFALLLTHHNADPDAIGSAYVFQSLLAKCRPNMTAEIGTGQGISRLSKHILKRIPITVNTQPNVEKADVIVLLDTNTIQQLGKLAERVTKTKAPIIVIDHHAAHQQT